MNRIKSIVIACLFGTVAMAQMPTLVLFPSDAWMKEHNYGENVTTNGRSKWVCDYQKAFDNENIDNTEISTALSTTSAILTSLNFKCEDLKASLDAMSSSDQDFEEMGFDTEEYGNQVIPDIRVDVNWKFVKKVMGTTQYSVQLLAKDNYTGDVIASIDEPGTLSAEGLKGDLRRAIENHISDFCSKLTESFERTLKYGREVKVVIGTRGGLNFNTDNIEGQVMKYYFRDVMKSIAKGGVSNNKRDNAHLQEYRVRIENGSKLEDIGEQLQNKFRNVGVPVEVKKSGIGSLVIAVGSR